MALRLRLQTCVSPVYRDLADHAVLSREFRPIKPALPAGLCPLRPERDRSAALARNDAMCHFRTWAGATKQPLIRGPRRRAV